MPDEIRPSKKISMGRETPFPIIELRLSCGVQTVTLEWRGGENQAAAFKQSHPAADFEHIGVAEFWERARKIVAADLRSPAAFEQLEFLDEVRGAFDGKRNAG